MRFSRRFLAILLAGTFLVRGLYADELPELGDVASTELSPATERRVGQQIMTEIRWREPSYLDDPDIEFYLNQLGGRLVAASNEPSMEFHFFAINDNSVNAFAMFGGYIGVHTGLILTAQSESELAGVLAHEISHVTQRHLARQQFQSKRVSMASLLAMGLSLLLALRRFAQPLVTELGELPGTRDYLDRARHPEARAVPGVLVMRPEEPLFFANADQTLRLVRQRIDQRDAQVVVLSLEVCDDLDGTSVEALAEFVDSLRGPAVPVLLARVKDRPRDALEHAGLLTNEQIALYWSVDDAVNAARRLTEPAAESSPGHH